MTMARRPNVGGAPGDRFAAPEFARAAGRRGLRAVMLLQVARTALRLGFIASAAIIIGRLVMQQAVTGEQVAVCLGLLVLSVLAGYATEYRAAGAEAQVADALRASAFARLDAMQARQVQTMPTGEVVVSMQRHPEAVAALVIGHRAASLMMAIGPLMAAAMLVLVSWQAAVLMLVLTPVMIIFFALVGESIRRRADEQERAFGRLAGQFADRVRTLPTIIANHGTAREELKLAQRLEAYAANTMSVLRIAFINAAIIDFFASLSIAMLAVFLGLGHLKLAMVPGFSNLELWQSLFILMIAPDYFAPFRRFSEQYHAKAEGNAAADAMDRLLNPPEVTPVSVAALERIGVQLPEKGLVAIVGPSGVGKSTLLRRIAGLEPVDSGKPQPVLTGPVSWVSTDCYIAGGRLRDVISVEEAVESVLPGNRLEQVARSVGLPDLLPGGLDAEIAEGGDNLSGGQRLRVSVVRALLRDLPVIADEPTAKLDAQSAAAVLRALKGASASRLVLAATHDEALADAADVVIRLGAGRNVEAAA